MAAHRFTLFVVRIPTFLATPYWGNANSMSPKNIQ